MDVVEELEILLFMFIYETHLVNDLMVRVCDECAGGLGAYTVMTGC